MLIQRIQNNNCNQNIRQHQNKKNINCTQQISFHRRNGEIKQAFAVLHQITEYFPSGSPWKAADIKNKHSGKKEIAAHVLNAKINIIRKDIESGIFPDYLYAAKTLEMVKYFKAANCKELATIAYLILKANKIKNGFCAFLYSKKRSGLLRKPRDLDQSICIILPPNSLPKDYKFSNKFFVDEIRSDKDTITPPRKAIVIDPLYGIADYWENAVLKYKNLGLFNIGTDEEMVINVREPLLTENKDIKKLIKRYPVLKFDKRKKKFKYYTDFEDSKNLFDAYKQIYSHHFAETYPAENPNVANSPIDSIRHKIISKIKTIFSYITSFIKQ